jgi:sigma-B regulation protein RsbU (phosphoserine phosphatase)
MSNHTKWLSLFALFALLCSPFAAHSQTTSAAEVPLNWSVNEHAGWRVQAGDDPASAQPGFDDSAWKPLDLSRQTAADTPAGPGRPLWYRLHLHLPMPGPVNLLLTDEAGAMEVYVDGHLAGPPLMSPVWWHNSVDVYQLRASGSQQSDIVIAVRSHAYGNDFGGAVHISAAIGDPDTIARLQRLTVASHMDRTIVPVAVSALSVVMGLLLVALFLQQRAHREYFWLGLSCIFAALSYGLLAPASAGFVPTSINAFLGDPSSYFCMIAQIEFIYSFTGQRPNRYVRLYEALLLVTPLICNPLIWFGLTPYGTLGTVESVVITPAVLLLGTMLVVWYWRGNREAGMLLVPVLLANITAVLSDVEYVFGTHYLARATLRWHNVEFGEWDISLILFLIAIGIVLFLRATRAAREQAFQNAELESARTVQHVLVPDVLPSTPNFRIESVYHPAQQVGGDFFQIIPLPESDSTLVVIGDVSGKGLPAAMNVALIVGTLGTLAETTASPAKILEGLNRRLYGRSDGFTTCLALRITRDGHATLANAGHINPFLAGKEIDVANGLPLGLHLQAAYEETELILAKGDTLTLVTDGVVEAQDPRTRALFGFERTAAISSRSAEEIAIAARNFGQEDDIAVLTLQYLPV